MRWRQILFALTLGGLLAASPAVARSLAENIARQLSAQGFGNVQIEDTWLGRTRITGNRSGESREIVVNPNTGEILRDLWLNDKGQVRAADIDVDDDNDETDDDSDDSDDDNDDDSDDDNDDDNDDDSGDDNDGDDGEDSDGNSGTGDGDDD